MRKLIPNDITVTEQLALRQRFMRMVDKCKDSLPVNAGKVDLEWLLKDSGVQCHQSFPDELLGFNIVDERAYVWFVLRWS